MRREACWISLLLVALACATRPPDEPGDLCAIFAEKRGWYRAAVETRERWGVPEAVQLAIVHRESSFRADARPPRRRFLWLFPGRRPSSAYGYGQVLDGTWELYRQDTGRGGADRHDFGDVSDFIGWYARRIREQSGIEPRDAYHLYLAYHEGPVGYVRGTHLGKPWLLAAAERVATRAAVYGRQYVGCRDRLDRGPWWSPF